MRLLTDLIFLVLFVFVMIVWLLAWAAFRVTGGGVHLLLVLAAIFLISHIYRGRTLV